MSNTAHPKRQRKAKREGPTLTRAITHIRLGEANRGKLDALDALWLEYKPLCERYMAYFSTKTAPDKDADFVFESELSARWQRVAVQQVYLSVTSTGPVIANIVPGAQEAATEG